MADASSSKMIQYCESKGWGFKPSGDQIILDKCPYCGAADHFYAAVEGKRDGLHDCKKCSVSGNLYDLKVQQKDRDPNFDSQKDWAGSDKTEQLPNADRCHESLMVDGDALDFLMEVRGFSMEIIQQQKLGIISNRYFRDLQKETKAIVIPYLKGGRSTFAKFRSFPPDAKAFSSPTGWDPPLYNEECIVEGMDELLFVEGEYDCLSCLSNGITSVVGVPGANMKKTVWVQQIDEAKPKKKYILYDNDRVGQKGAQDLAEKLGLEECYRIVLPDFVYVNDQGEEKVGKDINDWFRHGGGDLEKFEELKKAARKFDVKSVSSLVSALSDLERDFEGKEKDEAKYITQWDALNYKVGGFEDGDVIDIIARGGLGKTTFALNVIDDLVARYGEPGIIICGEMTPARLARKWLSMVTKTDDSPAKSDAEKIAKLQRMKDAIPLAKDIIRAREAELYFSNPHLKELDELYELVYQAKRRYGIKFGVFDNLQLFCDLTLRNDAHRTIHLSKLSKTIMRITKELGLVSFRIVQPRGISDEKIASSGDADGSSQIEKDCDQSWGLHRARKANVSASDLEAMGGYIDEEDTYEPLMNVNISKTRYSQGGKCTLLFEGATSSVADAPRSAASNATSTPTSYSSTGVIPRENLAPKMTLAPPTANTVQTDDITI